MKLWKKALAIGLTLALATGVVACGGEKAPEASSDAQPSAAATEEAGDAEKSEEPAAEEAQSEDKPAESAADAGSDQVFQIGIIQIVDHPALNAANQGFQDRLAELGIQCEFDNKNAQGDKANLKTISDGFVSGGKDLILAVSTDAAVSIASSTDEIPILGTAITDYMSANLVASNEAPGGNISGTSDMNPVKDQMDLLQQLVPDAKTVGFIFSSAEPNSRVQVDAAEAELDARGLKYEEVTVASVNDIQQAAQSLVGKVDVIYTPTDNTLASAIPSLVSVTEPAGLVVIGPEPGMVSNGCTATIGISYYKLGQQTADMAKRILIDGEKPAEMPIEFATSFDFYYNEESVEALGLTLPEDLLARAAVEE